ncbi:MAG TPA: pilus assembly protein TadG-related protein, partial [Xanthobacteraceae bacterium]|nr:pilus assembly protein TadG-related protein [Xanthobacteraceae bacterium]
MANFNRLFRNALGQMGRFRRNEGGTMALLAALSSIPLVFSVGAGIDYSTANMAKSKLDAVADAAALSAVDHNAISGTADDAKATATNVFNAEAINLKNVTMGTVTVTVTDANGGRTAVVTYTATKTNTFMGLMGIPTTTISGTASAAAGL